MYDFNLLIPGLKVLIQNITKYSLCNLLLPQTGCVSSIDMLLLNLQKRQTLPHFLDPVKVHPGVGWRK